MDNFREVSINAIITTCERETDGKWRTIEMKLRCIPKGQRNLERRAYLEKIASTRKQIATTERLYKGMGPLPRF